MIESNDNQIKVAIYIRVSTEDQVEKYGLPMQEASIRALINSKGNLEDARPRMVFAGKQYLYSENGVSGTTKLEERPAFSRLMEDVLNAPEGKRPFDAVAVYKIDRFARKLSVLLDTLEFFEENKISMMSANESIDTSTAFGRAVLGIIGVIAELEIETFKQRSKDGRQSAINRGVYMGESPPIGYIKNQDRVLEVLKPEAFIVQDIFRMFIIEQKSSQMIADVLSSRGVLSPSVLAIKHKKKRGGSRKKNKDDFWRAQKIRAILSDEIYIGNYWYGKTNKGVRVKRKDWKLSDYFYPAIIEKAEFIQAQELLSKSKARSLTKKRAKEGKHIYLLSGLLRCEECLEQHRTDVMPTWVGEPKNIKKNGVVVGRSYYYKCGRRNSKKYSNLCNVITLPADQVEEIVLEQVRDLVENPDPVINYQNNLKSTDAEIAHLKKRRDQYTKLINAVPGRIEKLKEQHANEFIETIEELKSKIEEQKKSKEDLVTKLKELDVEISQIVLSENYMSTLSFFKDKYLEVLSNINKDRLKTYNMLDTLLEKVVVKSRPVTPDDVISGRKKENQHIPYKINLYFKLPQDMLKEAETVPKWARFQHSLD